MWVKYQPSDRANNSIIKDAVNTRSSGAQLVPFGIMIICWNTSPSTLANILSIIFFWLYSYWQPGDGGRYYYTTWEWYMRTTLSSLYLYIRLIYVYITNFNSLHLSSISLHIAKWKTKIIHTVGTVSKSNGKIVVRRQIDTPNTQIHDVLITFLDLYNSCIGFNIFPFARRGNIDTPNTQILDKL
jgi:hypothetical protein